MCRVGPGKCWFPPHPQLYQNLSLEMEICLVCKFLWVDPQIPCFKEYSLFFSSPNLIFTLICMRGNPVFLNRDDFLVNTKIRLLFFKNQGTRYRIGTKES